MIPGQERAFLHTEWREAKGVQGGMEQAWVADPRTTRRETMGSLGGPWGHTAHTGHLRIGSHLSRCSR